MLLCVAAVWWLRLPLKARIAMSTARCVLQLLALGTLVLQPIFTDRHWQLALAIVCAMLFITAGEADARITVAYPGLRAHVTASLAAAVGMGMSLVCFAVVVPNPWWSPQYLIPLSGMLLNNALSAVAIAVGRFTADVHADGGDAAEVLLAAGASRWEAMLPMVADSLRMGLSPTLTTMNQIGLVAIPGMMTGQILGGNPPMQAAMYQAMIMFMICFTATAASAAALCLAVSALVDGERLCLRRSMLRKRPKSSDFLAGLLWWLLAPAVGGAVVSILRIAAPVCGLAQAAARWLKCGERCADASVADVQLAVARRTQPQQPPPGAAAEASRLVRRRSTPS
eukprot:TRINITY_DN14493_c0_g1_i1.p1 TRINITY_DN14493_c0_g1~~TRINITY_DN14493_c0_g1_i1.p1  ORF type:complete len:395 (+),score=90.72 TRINITY_DN14493_c0_g1_i1:168-1187(+)